MPEDKKISDRDPAATLTGDETIGLIQSGSDVKSTLADVADFITGEATFYKALLNQPGSDAPTATVIQNTTGITPSYSVASTGITAITATGKWVPGKYLIQNPDRVISQGGGDIIRITFSRQSNDVMWMATNFGTMTSTSPSFAMPPDLDIDITFIP